MGSSAGRRGLWSLAFIVVLAIACLVQIRTAPAREAVLLDVDGAIGPATTAYLRRGFRAASDRETALLASRENRDDFTSGIPISKQPPVIAAILLDLARRETNNRSLALARAIVAEVGREIRLQLEQGLGQRRPSRNAEPRGHMVPYSWR